MGAVLKNTVVISHKRTGHFTMNKKSVDYILDWGLYGLRFKSDDFRSRDIVS